MIVGQYLSTNEVKNTLTSGGRHVHLHFPKLGVQP